jgi:uncharacterized protein (TIGR00369 family)
MSDAQELHTRHVPFLELLNVRPIEGGEGKSRFEMTVEDRHLRTLGILHGGVAAALLDTALGYAAGSMAREGFLVLAVQLNVNFIRPAWKGETLIATGHVIHAGRQTAVATGEIRTTEDVLVGSGTGTYMYLPHPGDEFRRHDDRPD